MSPILGIYASQISGHLWAPSGAYDSIATVTVGAGGVSSVTFTGIPSNYTHLQIRGIVQQNTARAIPFRLNGSGSGYSDHQMYGNGSTTSSSAGSSNGYTSIARNTSTTDSTNTNMYSALIVDILDYANTNKYKTIRWMMGTNSNTGSNNTIEIGSGTWQSTTAVNEVDFITGASTFSQYSQFALYGVK